MKVGQIFLYDNENGKRWEYSKTTEKFFCQYWEFYKSIGWRKIGTVDEICKEDYYEALSLEVNEIAQG